MRATRSTVTFSNRFTLRGYPGDLPAGAYEVLVEEERLLGLSFEAYRRTGTYLSVDAKAAGPGQSALWVTTENDLNEALRRDADRSAADTHSDAALSPQEDRR
ncbi:hypothetical protein [Tritonibacter horizontis]|nr:hypothetical protein [Tritonibacter horizontis]